MAAGAYVNVPEELGESLISDGFRKAGVERGVDVGWTLSAGANVVTIFVARHEIARFIAHLWACARGRSTPTSGRPGSRLVFKDGDRWVAITLEHEGFGDNGPPRAVVGAMTALLEELTDPSENRPTAIPGRRP
jgi:hypothetical protein